MFVPENHFAPIKTLTLSAAVLFILLCTTTELSAEIRLTPRLSSGVEYTDNFYLTNGNPGSEEESQWITTITPGVTLDITGRTVDLSLSYDPSYTMYDEYSDRNYWNHAAGLIGTWRTTRHLNMELTHDYLRTEDPIDEDDLTIRRGRNLYTRNSSGARIDYQFGPDNTAYVDGLYNFLKNEDPTIEDSERYGSSAGVTYWFNIRWGVDIGAEYYQANYDESDDYTDLAGRLRLNHRFNPHFTGFVQYQQTDHNYDAEIAETDYMIYDGTVGFDYAIDPTMDLILEVHYFVRDFDGSEDESETPVNINFTKRFQRGSFSLAGEGGYDYTAVSAENLGYYIYYGATVSADYEFTSRISGDILAGYTYRDYKDQIPRREDDVTRVGCGLSVQLLRWLSARLGYTYRSVESSIETEDYVENRGSLLFTIAPPQPYRIGQ